MRRDPTIPRGGLSPSLSWGRFVDAGTTTYLIDMSTGQKWDCGDGSVVLYASGGQVNSIEGWHRAPRRWKYDDKGNLQVEGDTVLLDYIMGQLERPVVWPGYRAAKSSDADYDEDFFPYNPILADPNPVRARFASRNASGAVTGTVEMRALDGGAKVELVVGGTKFGEGVTVTLDFDAGRITMTADTVEVKAKDVVVDASSSIDLKTPSLDVYQNTSALATPVVVEGVLGFTGLLAGALNDLEVRLAALAGPGLENPALILNLQAGDFTSARTKTE